MATYSKKPPKNPDPTKLMSALEAAGLDFNDLEEPFTEANNIYNMSFGAPTSFSEEEERIMSVLGAQITSKQPGTAPPGVRSGIPGNRYSTSLSAMSQGVNQLSQALVNRDNANDLIGNPDKVKKFTSRAAERRAQAEELIAQANEMPDQLDLSVIAPGAEPAPNPLKTQLLEQAKALNEMADQDDLAAEDNTGILARYRQLQNKKDRSVNEENFRDEFISRFGLNAYNQDRQDERSEAAQEAQTKRTNIVQSETTKRALAREKASVLRARITAQSRLDVAKQKGESTSVKIPDTVKPNYIQAYSRSYIDELDEIIDELEGDPFGQALSPDDEQYLQSLKAKRNFAEELIIDATFYEEADLEGGLPPARQPNQREAEFLSQLEDQETPQELIDAYMYYNRLSFNAVPVLTAPSTPTSLGNSFNSNKQEQ